MVAVETVASEIAGVDDIGALPSQKLESEVRTLATHIARGRGERAEREWAHRTDLGVTP